ncbi:MAG: hypothetical protein SF069_03965 [Phycisphaerae bacterium]|nr:hypothetical protein [Phycisphaerae bacterium]
MSPQEQARFLSSLGHWITVIGRDGHGFQEPGVADALFLLRDLNEIHHRIYAQIHTALNTSQPCFPPDVIASWICGEGKPHLQERLFWAVNQALQR